MQRNKKRSPAAFTAGQIQQQNARVTHQYNGENFTTFVHLLDAVSPSVLPISTREQHSRTQQMRIALVVFRGVALISLLVSYRSLIELELGVSSFWYTKASIDTNGKRDKTNTRKFGFQKHYI